MQSLISLTSTISVLITDNCYTLNNLLTLIIVLHFVLNHKAIFKVRWSNFYEHAKLMSLSQCSSFLLLLLRTESKTLRSWPSINNLTHKSKSALESLV